MSSSPLVRQLRRQLMSIAKRFSETYTLDRLRHAVFRQSRAVAALLPYRLVRQSAFDFDRLPPLEQARYALKLPVPTKLPSLGNPQLESVVFRRGSLPDVSSEEDRESTGSDWAPHMHTAHFYSTERFRLYHTAFHRERLEFVGDRLLGQASATACLLMAPVPTFPTIPLSTMPSSSTSNVIWLQQTCVLRPFKLEPSRQADTPYARPASNTSIRTPSRRSLDTVTVCRSGAIYLPIRQRSSSPTASRHS